MSQLHEFKTKLLDRIAEQWENVCQSIPETYIIDNKEIGKMTQLLELWNGFHKLETVHFGLKMMK